MAYLLPHGQKKNPWAFFIKTLSRSSHFLELETQSTIRLSDVSFDGFKHVMHVDVLEPECGN